MGDRNTHGLRTRRRAHTTLDERSRQHRRAVGARPIAVAIVEPIDWASLLRYSIFASPRDLNVLRGVVDGMVRADPRLRREAENVRAPIRVATRIQRAWRSRRAAKGDASASSP